MTANQGLREVCAEILEGLAHRAMWRRGEFSRSIRRLRGADMLRWAERFEYGDPVPADEHVEALAALESAHDAQLESVRDDELNAQVLMAALKNLEDAFVKWDDDRDDAALIGAWDEYRAVAS